jgi:hypothetical protein
VQTDRTIPNNNAKATCMLVDLAVLGDRNMMKTDAEKILRYKDLTIEIHSMCHVKTKRDTNNHMDNWNHLKIIQKIPEPHTGKARNQETAENSHIGHCTHTSESTDVKVQ